MERLAQENLDQTKDVTDGFRVEEERGEEGCVLCGAGHLDRLLFDDEGRAEEEGGVSLLLW